MALTSSSVPALWRLARLDFDSVRQQHVLLYPEGAVLLNPTGAAILELCDGVDVLIHDAQHTAAELPSRASFGHSAADYAVRLGELAGARSVLLFHHDPNRTDVELDAMVDSFALSSLPVSAAAEGTVLTDLRRLDGCSRDAVRRADGQRRIQSLRLPP